jgi:hypothetical protein
MARDDVAYRGACMETEEKVCRRNKKKEEVEKHRGHGAHRHCALPRKKKAVCENIKHGNHEDERWENSKI